MTGMSNIERVCVRLDSQDKATWDAALAIALAICAKSAPPMRDVVLLIHTKGQLKTALANHVGAAQIKVLDKGGKVSLPAGVSLSLETTRTVRGFRTPTVVIGYFAEMRMLDQIDGLHGMGGVVAVPDLLEEADPWIARWSPRIYGQAAPASAPLVADQKIEGALIALSRSINLGNGMLNARDKQAVQEVLRILRAKGHSEPPANIHSWAIKSGWQLKAAQELAVLAGKAWALKSKPSLAGIHDPDGRYGRW